MNNRLSFAFVMMGLACLLWREAMGGAPLQEAPMDELKRRDEMTSKREGEEDHEKAEQARLLARLHEEFQIPERVLEILFTHPAFAPAQHQKMIPYTYHCSHGNEAPEGGEYYFRTDESGVATLYGRGWLLKKGKISGKNQAQNQLEGKEDGSFTKEYKEISAVNGLIPVSFVDAPPTVIGINNINGSLYPLATGNRVSFDQTMVHGDGSDVTSHMVLQVGERRNGMELNLNIRAMGFVVTKQDTVPGLTIQSKYFIPDQFGSAITLESVVTNKVEGNVYRSATKSTCRELKPLPSSPD